MAQKIRQSEEASGIDVGGACYKLSLYGDDLMLYVTDIDKSIPHLLQIIEQFSKMSDYKMNVGKKQSFCQ